ncbi:sulfur reduction protein DsrE [Cryomorpha ignava]|uniref:Sulfur reduction protein DsrE n=1 Tax=Cryomorpha ignava TaxID=101383 RepID=A0A7K3WRG6_9FLAO|nr:DsrE family protein [Cryomorpha ignava]NEN24267.1 sulfur reduction protein DsrE [Cryomorpha ignava]
MKKYIFSITLVALTMFGASNVIAQQMESKNNYVVLTKKVPQLKPIILTAEALKEEDGQSHGDFQVIICGKDIGEITETEKMQKFIEMAEKAGVELVACGFSLNKFKIDKTKVPKEMKIVENGILHNFQLQNKGYKSISL